MAKIATQSKNIVDICCSDILLFKMCILNDSQFDTLYEGTNTISLYFFPAFCYPPRFKILSPTFCEEVLPSTCGRQRENFTDAAVELCNVELNA